MSEAIERRILDLLTAKSTSQALSNALFGPLGLFNKIAQTEQERQAVAKTPLFQQAHARIMELERAEIAALLLRIDEEAPPADSSNSAGDGVGDESGAVLPMDGERPA